VKRNPHFKPGQRYKVKSLRGQAARADGLARRGAAREARGAGAARRAAPTIAELCRDWLVGIAQSRRSGRSARRSWGSGWTPRSWGCSAQMFGRTTDPGHPFRVGLLIGGARRARPGTSRPARRLPRRLRGPQEARASQGRAGQRRGRDRRRAGSAYGGLASRGGLLNDSLYSEAGLDGRGSGRSARIRSLRCTRTPYLLHTNDAPFWALSSIGGGRSDIGAEQPLRGFGADGLLTGIPSR